MRRGRLALAALSAMWLGTGLAAPRDATPIETWIDHPFRVPVDTDVSATPVAGAPSIGRLRGGVEILVVGSVAHHAWLQIKLPDGKTVGYVPASAVPAATGEAGSEAAGPAAPAPAAAPAVSPIVGHPIVRDTATLVLGQRDIHLFGVLGESGAMADGLQNFISANGGTVTCAPQDAGHYVCRVPGNIDVAMVALLNGAARMTVDAPDLYREQQTAAQAKKLGIWASP